MNISLRRLLGEHLCKMRIVLVNLSILNNKTLAKDTFLYCEKNILEKCSMSYECTFVKYGKDILKLG